MPQTERSGPHHRGRPGTTFTEAQGNPTPVSVPTVRALLIPGAGRCGRDAVVVTECPWCDAQHLHRGGVLDGSIRKSVCRDDREYLLAVSGAPPLFQRYEQVRSAHPSTSAIGLT